MSTYGIQQTEILTDYLRNLLAVELAEGDSVELPLWPLEILEEVHFAVKVVRQAIENKSR